MLYTALRACVFQARSCDTGRTCWRTRDARSPSGTRFKRCRRRAELVAPTNPPHTRTNTHTNSKNNVWRQCHVTSVYVMWDVSVIANSPLDQLLCSAIRLSRVHRLDWWRTARWTVMPRVVWYRTHFWHTHLPSGFAFSRVSKIFPQRTRAVNDTQTSFQHVH